MVPALAHTRAVRASVRPTPLDGRAARENPHAPVDSPRRRGALRVEGAIMHPRRIFFLCLLLCLCVAGPDPASAAGRTHVYLFRGIFNVSVGLDALAAKLSRMGIDATVYGSDESGAVASEAISDYRGGKVHA